VSCRHAAVDHDTHSKWHRMKPLLNHITVVCHLCYSGLLMARPQSISQCVTLREGISAGRLSVKSTDRALSVAAKQFTRARTRANAGRWSMPNGSNSQKSRIFGAIYFTMRYIGAQRAGAKNPGMSSGYIRKNTHMTISRWARRIRDSSYGARAITRYTSRAAVALVGIVSVSGVIAAAHP
jgi:hypothetical protein